MASGLDGIRSIEELELKGKRVFLRLDLNVPLKDGKITDDTRIQKAIPTIKYCLEKGAKLVLASHLGRPKTPEDRPKFSLEPVGTKLSELLGKPVTLVDDPAGDAPKHLLRTADESPVLLLENLRFEAGETKNDPKLAQKWAEYTDVYINDAFGASHRAHASISGLASLVRNKGLGFLMKQEVEMLDRVLYSPESPFVALVGGAKVSDKIGVLEKLMDSVDTFLIGGAMSYTFLKAKGEPVGNSLVEANKVNVAKHLLERIDARRKRLLLPVDHVVADKLEEGATAETSDTIREGKMALDIGPKTTRIYSEEIKKAKMVFWNGPMGVFEVKPFGKGTFAMAEALAECEGLTIVGGGDSVAAVNQSGLSEKMTHISTGGGASLEYLEAGKLPGLEALK